MQQVSLVMQLVAAAVGATYSGLLATGLWLLWFVQLVVTGT